VIYGQYRDCRGDDDDDDDDEAERWMYKTKGRLDLVFEWSSRGLFDWSTVTFPWIEWDKPRKSFVEINWGRFETAILLLRI
jgi:hypothetical protein